MGVLIERAMARPSDTQLLEPISLAAAQIALRAARGQGLSSEDSEDVAQASAMKLLTMIGRGESPVQAEALVWRIAENKAKDAHRRRQSKQRGVDRLTNEVYAQSQSAEDAESLWLKREARDHAKKVVRKALTLAPENYRVALEHHLDGLPVEMLAETFYATMVAEGAVARSDESVSRAKKKARNRADQHLKRGKDWLRAHLQSSPDEGAQ